MPPRQNQRQRPNNQAAQEKQGQPKHTVDQTITDEEINAFTQNDHDMGVQLASFLVGWVIR